MIISNNNFIKIFKEWADAKAPLINDFGYGPLSDWGNSRQLKYPCMWVTHQPTSSIVVQNKNLTPTHNFTIIFVDQINLQDNTQKQNGNDSDNRIHIMSDTQQLAFDFINDTILTFNKFKILAEPNITLSPIEDETTDKVNGWALDISFRTPYLNCTLPSITPTQSCQPAVVKNSDNTFSLSIPSGVTDTLPDSIITINNDSINLPATNDITINVKLDGVDSGSWDESTNTWEVESLPCPNAIVTLDGESFLSLDAGSTTNITIKDEDGNSINPIGSVGSTIIVPNEVEEEWIRPSDWLPIPTITPTEQVFYGLCAVYQDRSNLVSLRMTGNYTVDWGDGVIENFASNVVAHHQYSWSSVGNVTSDGFRQALIKVTPQVGQNLTGINLHFKHPSMGGGDGKSSIFIDMVMNLPQLIGLGNSIVFGQLNGVITHSSCQRVRIDSIGSCNTLANLCINFFELQKFEIGDTTNVTSMTGVFQSCLKLTTVPLFNTQNVTNMVSMFSSCLKLTTVPLFNTTNVTNMMYMFQSCYSLTTVSLFNTTNVTNMQQMFQNCYVLTTVPLFNTTNVANMLQMFQNCFKLTAVPLFNTQNVTTMQQMLYSCISLQTLPLFNTTNVANMLQMFFNCATLQAIELTSSNLSLANLNSTFQYCPLLTSMNITLPATGVVLTNAFVGTVTIQHLILTGCRYGFSILNNEMSATALNDLFTSLGTASGSQTITVTGNPGASTCNTSIATSKGFTVVI